MQSVFTCLGVLWGNFHATCGAARPSQPARILGGRRCPDPAPNPTLSLGLFAVGNLLKTIHGKQEELDTFAFYFVGFRAQTRYWESMNMFRKLSMILCLTFVQDTALKVPVGHTHTGQAAMFWHSGAHDLVPFCLRMARTCLNSRHGVLRWVCTCPMAVLEIWSLLGAIHVSALRTAVRAPP